MISNNINKMRNKKILVLKDNAYGFDLDKLIDISINQNQKYFAVKELVEANKIKEKILDSRIIILGNKLSLDSRFEYTICNEKDYQFCKINNLNFHIKLNLGMNRFGMNDLNYKYAEDELCKGIYFHSPNKNKKDNEKQLNKFKNIISKIKKDNLLYHVGGSCYLDMEHDYYVRTGIAMYENSFTLEGNILEIREVKKNETVGYTDIYKVKKDILVGICDIGYVNGISRNNKNNYVIINEKKYKLIGVKCMDFCFIEIDSNVLIGDSVIFIGKNIDEYKQINNVTEYEIYLNAK